MTPAPTRMAAWLESAWLARYLDRQLEGEELAWFEAYLLDKPELVEAVEVDNDIRDAASIASDGMAGEADARKERSRLPMWLGFAATVALGIAGGWMGGRQDSATIQANPTRIVFDTLRGEGSKPIVQGALSGTYVLVEVAVPAEAKGIVLRIEPNESRALTTSADGFVSFLMKREDLPQTATIEYEQSGDRKQRTIDFRDLEKKS